MSTSLLPQYCACSFVFAKAEDLWFQGVSLLVYTDTRGVLIAVAGAAQAARFSEALQGAVDPLHVQAAHFREALGLPPVCACPYVVSFAADTNWRHWFRTSLTGSTAGWSCCQSERCERCSASNF